MFQAKTIKVVPMNDIMTYVADKYGNDTVDDIYEEISGSDISYGSNTDTLMTYEELCEFTGEDIGDELGLMIPKDAFISLGC